MGMVRKEIKKVLEETAFDSTIYITVDTLEYLKGRPDYAGSSTAGAFLAN